MTRKSLKIYIEDEEELELRIRMDRVGYKYKSKYIRDVMLNNYIYHNLFKTVAVEVNKIGSNLNQISRYANTTKQLDKDVLSALLKIDLELSKILLLIEEKTK